MGGCHADGLCEALGSSQVKTAACHGSIGVPYPANGGSGGCRSRRIMDVAVMTANPVICRHEPADLRPMAFLPSCSNCQLPAVAPGGHRRSDRTAVATPVGQDHL